MPAAPLLLLEVVVVVVVGDELEVVVVLVDEDDDETAVYLPMVMVTVLPFLAVALPAGFCWITMPF